jgi:cyanophycinase
LAYAAADGPGRLLSAFIEDTAAIIRGDEVEIIDSRVRCWLTSPPPPPIRTRCIQSARRAAAYLDRGDRYHFKTQKLTPSAEKLAGKKLDPADAGYAPYYSKANAFYADVLGDTVVTNLMATLIDSPLAEITGLAFSSTANDAKPDLGFEFRFRKGPGSVGYFSSAGGGGEHYTVSNIASTCSR